jgi:hypothetical protein
MEILNQKPENSMHFRIMVHFYPEKIHDASSLDLKSDVLESPIDYLKRILYFLFRIFSPKINCIATKVKKSKLAKWIMQK